MKSTLRPPLLAASFLACLGTAGASWFDLPAGGSSFKLLKLEAHPGTLALSGAGTGLGSTDPVLLFAGRLSEEKGVLELPAVPIRSRVFLHPLAKVRHALARTPARSPRRIAVLGADLAGVLAGLALERMHPDSVRCLVDPVSTRLDDADRWGYRCAAASEELTGKVLCYAPRVGNILYLFSGKWSGPTNAIPPQEVLGDWKIEAIIWKPPAERAASGK